MSNPDNLNIETLDIKRPQPPQWLMGVLLILTLLVGGYFRFLNVNWDNLAYLHPDERFLTVNLLPALDSGLRFTPDLNVPPQSILIRSDASYASTVDIQSNSSLQIGVVRGEFAGQAAGWWVGDTRVSVYDSLETAGQALGTGSIDAILTGELQAQNYLTVARPVNLFSTLTSEQIQRYRCNAANPNTNGIGGYFDTHCSTLNPHNVGVGAYAYGTLPLFMTHSLTDIAANFSLVIDGIDLSNGTLAWRFLSALFDTLTILMVFLLGRRLHNGWVGLLAAILYAAAPLAIQKAHFGTVNAITNFFVVFALYMAAQVQINGRYMFYALFGVGLGAAMAGRINVVPLAGVVVLAGMMNAAPALDSRLSATERNRLIWHNVGGVFLAGFMTVLVFRIFNPYAFVGSSFLGIMPNARWLGDATQSSFNVSGASDIPPNWQWLGRPSYIYPLKDMILWGMGLASGVLAWVGFLWAGSQLVRRKLFATRNILIFAWVLVYFAWIGDLWVMTMRYYLPLYGALMVFAGWALYEAVMFAQRNGRDAWITRLLLYGFGIVLALIPVYYLSRGDELTTTAIFAGVTAAILLIAALMPFLSGKRIYVLSGFALVFSMLWALMFTNIYRSPITRIEASEWVWANVSGDFSMQIEGAAEDDNFINVAITNGRGESSPDPVALSTTGTSYLPGSPKFVYFTAPASGTISTIHAPHLGDVDDDVGTETLYISVSALNEPINLSDTFGVPDTNNLTLLTEVNYTTNFSRENHVLGDSYDIAFESPITVEAGQQYLLKVEASEGHIVGGGSVLITEGDWDDRITTTRICELPDAVALSPGSPTSFQTAGSGCGNIQSWYELVHSYDLAMSYPIDEPLKRDDILNGLEQGDYISITSNRFYDSEMRNPHRWPLTTRYYEALFSGELGYDLVATFSQHYEFGPLSVDDQHLPIYDSPQWFNEFESDEAFNVYDHPAVFIFRKSDDYDHARAELILNSVSLTRYDQLLLGGTDTTAQTIGAIYRPSLESDEAVTALEMPADVRDINYEGGTWSERFDSDSTLNTNQVLGVVVWWLVVMAYGFIAWPILFTIFPEMGDRGYGFAKIVGLFLVGWVAWFASSLKLQLWSQQGIVIVLLLVIGLSVFLALRRRQAMMDYLREHWGRLALIELITLILFLFLIGIRLLNPDLWHHPMGGEKPMDFAYFNAVLRSTVFPAYDPWYSEGFINYYYFGFNIVGSPVLLLKLVPAFAYNLIVPTVFATTGIGAFSVAFNIVERWRENQDIVDEVDGKKLRVPYSVGNPWLAGIAALLLCVVLGNLDVPRIFVTEGVGGLAGYQRPTGLEDFLMQQYQWQNGVPPDQDTMFRLIERAQAGHITDELMYEVHNGLHVWASFFRGLPAAIEGQWLPMGSNRWYWGPTRVLNETPGVMGNAINEIPYFTFLYGDLHAHMINMPLMLFVMLFLFNEVAVAQRDRRSVWAMVLAVGLAGMTVGMMRATNTWDWPTFTILGVVGLGYAWWRRWETISRASLVHLVGYIGGFLTISFFAVWPYATWYAAIYNSVSLWEGGKTPLWAYWNMHGTFLFTIVSLFVWETGRWLRNIRVQEMRRHRNTLWALATITVIVLVGSVVAAFIEYQVALIALPLIWWGIVLFFRPEQSVPMQFVIVLMCFALALTMAVEIVVIAGDIGRQNTLFKFYIQVWLFFSVAGGAAFAWVVQRSYEWRLFVNIGWWSMCLVLFVTAAMYPILSTRARMVDRMAPQTPLTLNGLDYMQYADHQMIYYLDSVPMATDYALIRWLQENVEGTPIIMEGRTAASEYTYTGRIAINTGLPTILGWRFHQTQQRSFEPLPQMVNQREFNIKYFYRTGDILGATNMLRHYDVSYVIVSDYERSMVTPGAPNYPVQTTDEGLAKFETMVELGLLTVAFQEGEGVIYEVNKSALEDFVLIQNVVADALSANLFRTFDAENTTLAEVVIETLRTYQPEFVAVDNLLNLGQINPDALSVLNALESLSVLEVVQTSADGRVYRVDLEALEAASVEED